MWWQQRKITIQAHSYYLDGFVVKLSVGEVGKHFQSFVQIWRVRLFGTEATPYDTRIALRLDVYIYTIMIHNVVNHRVAPEFAINFILVLLSLNFCKPKKKRRIRLKSQAPHIAWTMRCMKAWWRPRLVRHPCEPQRVGQIGVGVCRLIDAHGTFLQLKYGKNCWFCQVRLHSNHASMKMLVWIVDVSLPTVYRCAYTSLLKKRWMLRVYFWFDQLAR